MIDHQRTVRVFRNWKHDCYSIMQDGVIRASARQVLLSDVEFMVRASGRRRMLEHKRKNVHAYAVGMLQLHVHPSDDADIPALTGRTAFYDPYRFDTFVDGETLEPVLCCPRAMLAESGLTYVPPPLLQAA